MDRQSYIELMRRHHHIARSLFHTYGPWKAYAIQLNYSLAHNYAKLARTAGDHC